MLNEKQRQAVLAAASRHGIEPAALMAVIAVESGGRVSVRIDGRDEPLIRWEGHYFDRLRPPQRRAHARALGLASPTAGAVANPASQAERWALLERAIGIDRDAAYASVSWGIGQVMGAHWAWLGYESVLALVAEARAGFEGQLALMMRYIDKAALLPALAARDWEAFARGYNGPAYRRHGYHTRLAAAYARYAGSPASSTANDVLQRGDRGEEVEALQALLVLAGHSVVVDGIFGPKCEAALLAFQRDNGLLADGLAGPRTMAALQSKRDPASNGGSGSFRGALLRLLRMVPSCREA